MDNKAAPMNDNLTDLVQATPPVGINMMLLGGIPLAQWVIILNFIYIALLLSYKLWRIWKEHHNGSK